MIVETIEIEPRKRQAATERAFLLSSAFFLGAAVGAALLYPFYRRSMARVQSTPEFLTPIEIDATTDTTPPIPPTPVDTRSHERAWSGSHERPVEVDEQSLDALTVARMTDHNVRGLGNKRRRR